MATMPPHDRAADALRDRIVHTALALAEEQGWENVRLYQVADRLDLPLTTIAVPWSTDS